MAWLSGLNMGAQKQHPGLHKVYKKYLSSFLFECQIASRVEFKVTLVTFDFTFLMSNHFTFFRSFKVTLAHLLVFLLMLFFKSPLVQISKPCWSHLTLLFFVCLLKLPVVKDSKSQWSRLNLFVLCQFKLPVAEHSKSHGHIYVYLYLLLSLVYNSRSRQLDFYSCVSSNYLSYRIQSHSVHI